MAYLVEDEEFGDVTEGPVSDLVRDDGQYLVAAEDAVCAETSARQQPVIQNDARTRPEAVQVRVHLRRTCRPRQCQS